MSHFLPMMCNVIISFSEKKMQDLKAKEDIQVYFLTFSLVDLKCFETSDTICFLNITQKELANC